MKMKDRILSLLLALVLVLSMTPAALAYDGQAPVQSELAAEYAKEVPAYEVEEPPSPARAQAQQDDTLSDSSYPLTGWEEAIPWSELPVQHETQIVSGAVPSEDQVYQTINSLRSKYPEGMTWTDETHEYRLSVPIFGKVKDANGNLTEELAFVPTIGTGCAAFCFLLSDIAFGEGYYNAYKIYDFTYDDVRIGDVLRVNGDRHSVTVLEKYDDHVVLAEANIVMSPNTQGVVHWGRTMTRAEVMKADYVLTRYPATLTSVNVTATPSTVQPGGEVKVTVRSPIPSTYNLKLWKGATTSGTPQWQRDDIPPSSSYLFSRTDPGVYTVYVEALNGTGQLISGITTFTVTDGKPSNVKVSTDKSQYAPGETIAISYSAEIVDSYNLTIWRGAYGTGTKATSSSDLSGSRVYWQTSTPGMYTVYLEAVNSKGSNSATCQFTVMDGKPSNLKLTADRSAFVLGEPFYVTVAATDMDGFNVQLWEGDYGTGTLSSYMDGFDPNSSIKVTINTAGRYTLYVEAYNSYGTATATISVTATPTGLQFFDIPAGAYYTDAVEWALGKNITNGTNDEGTAFSPDATVTRCEAVTFLWRALGRPAPFSSENDFTDISANAYYFDAVQWAVENGIVNGMTLTTFEPDGLITRGQMVTLLWRALGKPGETGQGAWYADAEYWARSKNLLLGTQIAYGTDLVCPRSDVVYYMWNALK